MSGSSQRILDSKERLSPRTYFGIAAAAFSLVILLAAMNPTFEIAVALSAGIAAGVLTCLVTAPLRNAARNRLVDTLAVFGLIAMSPGSLFILLHLTLGRIGSAFPFSYSIGSFLSWFVPVSLFVGRLEQAKPALDSHLDDGVVENKDR